MKPFSFHDVRLSRASHFFRAVLDDVNDSIEVLSVTPVAMPEDALWCKSGS